MSSESSFADAFALHFHVVDKIRPSGKIHRHADQRFIHREIRMRKSHQSLFVSESFLQSQSQADADVLDGMMRIDPQVSLAGNIQIEDSVLRKEIEHVIQKLHSGLHIAPPASVKIQGNGNIRLVRGSANSCCSSVHVDSRALPCAGRYSSQAGAQRG